MCCSGSEAAGWRDERGRPFHQGVNETSCLYVTTGHGVYHKPGCSDHTPGLHGDVTDSIGEIQSLYIYISDDEKYGMLNNKNVYIIYY